MNKKEMLALTSTILVLLTTIPYKNIVFAEPVSITKAASTETILTPGRSGPIHHNGNGERPRPNPGAASRPQTRPTPNPGAMQRPQTRPTPNPGTVQRPQTRPTPQHPRPNPDAMHRPRPDIPAPKPGVTQRPEPQRPTPTTVHKPNPPAHHRPPTQHRPQYNKPHHRPPMPPPPPMPIYHGRRHYYPSRPSVYHVHNMWRNYPYERRSNIVINIGWGSSNVFSWARLNRLSFGEYILLCTISELLEDTSPSELYYIHRSGRSYQNICADNNLDWYEVQDNSRYRYDYVHDAAYNDGLSLWEWNDSLYY